MRLKKDEVRNKILASAKEEFFEKGYNDASIRSIAEKAGVTPGNIYRYYESKDELFEAIVSPVSESLSRLVRNDKLLPEERPMTWKLLLKFFVNVSLDLAIKYKYEVVILFGRSKGSSFEGMGNQIIEYTSEAINKIMKIDNSELSMVLGKSVLRSLIEIIERHLEDEEVIKLLSKEYLYLVFGDFESKIKEIK